MDSPPRWDDEDARKLAIAADDGGPRYLQHNDGSWSLIGADGWEVDPEDLHADVLAALALVSLPVIDVDAVSRRDNEVR